MDGVRTAESWAFPPRELRVEIDAGRMATLGITPGQLLDALRSENSDTPAGTLDIGPRSFTLKTSGSYESLDQVRDTVVTSDKGIVTRIRDVAKVFWADQPWSYVGRFNGKRAVFVSANQKDGYNIQDVRDRIAAAVAPAPPHARLKKAALLVQPMNVASALVQLIGAVVVVAEDRHRRAQVRLRQLFSSHKVKHDPLALLDGQVEIYDALFGIGVDLAPRDAHPRVALVLVVVDEALDVFVDSLGTGATKPQAAVLEKTLQLQR